MARFVGLVCTAAAAAGFSGQEVFGVRLALHEAITNAAEHGHQGDWTKPITVRYYVSADSVGAVVDDRGEGFDPEQVPDPTALENLERESGRGLFLMRRFMSKVCHNQQGNAVCFCKTRSQPMPLAEAIQPQAGR
jgi:serine/threonine-protein kinase RsbW